jgi:hypothetical protein
MSMALVERTLVESNMIVAAKDQIGCNLGDEEVILDLTRGIYYGLNSVGSRIWELVQAPITVEEIIDAVSSEYSVDRTECKEDVCGFLLEMAEHGLLEQIS